MLEDTTKQVAVQDRRRGGDRRGPQPGATLWLAAGNVERRLSERRANPVPPLYCPACRGPLQYDSELSWNLPDSYTVDAGYCPSCLRRFLRDRETGDYDALAY